MKIVRYCDDLKTRERIRARIKRLRENQIKAESKPQIVVDDLTKEEKSDSYPKS